LAYNPINLALRFILELVALFALGYWGWSQASGAFRFVLAIGIPLVAALIWGVFRVVEPMHNQNPPVHVPGIVRLVIEVVYFAAAAYALYDASLETWGIVFAVVVGLHYLVSYERVLWLLKL